MFANELINPDNSLLNRANRLFRVSHRTVNGVVVDNVSTYDTLGRLLDQSIPDGAGGNQADLVTSLAYGADDRISEMRFWASNADQVFGRDASGHLTSIADFVGVNPTGRQTLFSAWRTDGQPGAVTVHDITTALSYDTTTGNLNFTQDDLGRTTQFAHDPAGNVSFFDDGGASTFFAYDDNNRLETITDADGNVTLFGYEQGGGCCADGDRLTSIITPDLNAGEQWSFAYDVDGRLQTVTDPLGNAEGFTYFDTGDLQSVTDRLSRTTSFTYDQLGRPQTTMDPTGRAGVFAYPVPASGNWVGPQIFAASPDAAVPPTSLTAALADGEYQVGQNAFTPGGFPAQIELYRDATFELSFGMSFDIAGRVEDRQDRSNVPIASTSVFGGFPSSIIAPFVDERYAYDSDSHLPLLRNVSLQETPLSFSSAPMVRNEFFDITKLDDSYGPGPSLVFENLNRDAAGRLATVETRYSPNTQPEDTIIQYDDTLGGRIDRIDGPSGIQEFTYDNRGLVQQIRLSFRYDDPEDGVEVKLVGNFDFQYDEVGRNTVLHYPRGLTRTQDYDSLGRLISRCYTKSGSTRCYEITDFDAVGNPKTIEEPGGTVTIDYDNLDRVISVTRPGQTETYSYNALGALSTHDGDTVDHQRPRLDGNGVAAAGIPATHGGDNVVLDAGGRVTSLLGATLAYSKRTGSLLQQVNDSFTDGTGTTQITEEHGYDPLLRRIGTTRTETNTEGTTTITELFQYQGDNISAVHQPGTGLGTIKKRILYEGTDHPLWMLDFVELENEDDPDLPGDIRPVSLFFEIDLFGNVRRLRGDQWWGSDAPDPPTVTDNLGGYEYTAFGRLVSETTFMPRTLNNEYSQPIRWQGRWYTDVAGGIYDIRARWWSPELGAFLSADEFAFLTKEGTLWSWPGQNPYRWHDPSGLRPLTSDERAFLGDYFGSSLDTSSIDVGTSISSRAWSPYGRRISLPSSAFKGGTESGGINLADPRTAAIFAHEATHVWQRQEGAWVTTEGAVLQALNELGVYDPYVWDVGIRDPSEILDQFLEGTIEQQAQIVEDFVLAEITGGDTTRFQDLAAFLKSGSLDPGLYGICRAP